MPLSTLLAAWHEAASDGPAYHRLPRDSVQAHRVLLTLPSHEGIAREARPRKPDPSTRWDRDTLHSLTKNGGFTFHDHPGDGPTSGYMVAVAGAEQVHPVRDLQHNPSIIADYLSLHADKLAHPSAHFGAWVHKGKAFLDISHHTHDLDEAKQLAQQHNQLGIYDLGSGSTIYTKHHHAAQVSVHCPGCGQKVGQRPEWGGGDYDAEKRAYTADLFTEHDCPAERQYFSPEHELRARSR